MAELPFSSQTSDRIEGLVDEPWAVFLSSGGSTEFGARFDIFAAQPIATLITRGEQTEICDASGCRCSAEDPFELVRQELGPHLEAHPFLPFLGGAIGYFGYDLARRIETLPVISAVDENVPDMMVGIYDWAFIVDHQQKRSWLVSAGRDERTLHKWDDLVRFFSDRQSKRKVMRPAVAGEVQYTSDFDYYTRAFTEAKKYIVDGDCYQVNFAHRFEADFTGDAWTAFKRFLKQTRAPFSAYLNYAGIQVLSVSPERFMRVRNDQVMTQPIKGTAPRSRDPIEDRLLAEQLERSEKDRAENLMIVDLMRSDLSKSCAANSVRVPRLFELQSFRTVHHLVSTVSGRLQSGVDAADLLRGCFPGGSVTGTPKIGAMEIIEKLETHRRGVYCGSIGYLGFDGNMDTNIAIRTATINGGRIHYWAGGGLVADSQLESEYQETLNKAEVFFRLICVIHRDRCNLAR